MEDHFDSYQHSRKCLEKFKKLKNPYEHLFLDQNKVLHHEDFENNPMDIPIFYCREHPRVCCFGTYDDEVLSIRCGKCGAAIWRIAVAREAKFGGSGEGGLNV